MALTGIAIGGAAGTGTVGVPEVLDLPRAEAEAKLRDFGLVPRSRTVEAEGAEGTVFSQNPAARTIRARGSVVTLLIITSPVVPPDLGKQLATLQASVDAIGSKVDASNTKLDSLGTAVAAVETDAAADTRYEAIIERLDTLPKPGGGARGKAPGTARDGA